MIIAEIGTSHEGSRDKAKALVDAAVDAGCDAVKFQWVYADEILHPKTGYVKLPTGDIPLYERFRQLECPVSFYREMLDYAHSRNVKFVCSPFGTRSLKELLSLNPDAVKIASPELNHFPLLTALQEYRISQKAEGKTPVPVILSSGVSTLKDIEKALSITGSENVTLLHCITSYPAPEEEYNVRLIGNLSRIFGIPCGLSDHSLDPVLVPCLAASQGSVMTEKHITLSRKTSGLDDPVALEGEQFAQMVMALHQCEAALNRYGKEKGSDSIISQMSEQFGMDRVQKVLGTGIKRLSEAEKNNYGRTNRSLHYMNSFPCGHKISEGDISVLRTEKVLTPGISPDYLPMLTGKTITRAVNDGDGVQLTDFMN